MLTFILIEKIYSFVVTEFVKLSDEFDIWYNNKDLTEGAKKFKYDLTKRLAP